LFELNESFVELLLGQQNAAKAKVVGGVAGVDGDRLAQPSVGTLEIARLPSDEPQAVEAPGMRWISSKYSMIPLSRLLQTPRLMVESGFLEQTLNLR
jgi:hypothetical protein